MCKTQRTTQLFFEILEEVRHIEWITFATNSRRRRGVKKIQQPELNDDAVDHLLSFKI